jgi:hypothetical protein
MTGVKHMKIAMLGLSLLLLTGCAGAGSQLPRGAVAGCVDVEYTGTFTKSETSGRVLFLSESQAARLATTQDAIDMANAFGCGNRE